MLIFVPKLCVIFCLQISNIRDAGECSTLAVEDHIKLKRGVFDPLKVGGRGLPDNIFEKWMQTVQF